MKTTKLLALVLALFLLALPLTSCNLGANEDLDAHTEKNQSSNAETIVIPLTKENYNQYIAFNVTFDNHSHSALVTELEKFRYISECNMIITTYAKQPNIQFKNVSIKYNVSSDTLPKPTLIQAVLNSEWYTNSSEFNQTTDLSYEGFSESSFYIYRLTAGSLPSFPNTDQSLINIDTITGYVIITE